MVARLIAEPFMPKSTSLAIGAGQKGAAHEFYATPIVFSQYTCCQ
jgi:hypothetical protein